MTECRLYVLAMMLLVALLVPAAQAQNASVSTRVTYVAGQNVYVDAGRDQGVLPDDTLDVYRDGAALGLMVVVSSIADRSVLTFAGTPFAVTRGETVRLLGPNIMAQPVPADPVPEPEVVEPTEEAPEEEAAPPEESVPPEPRRDRNRPELSGRIMVSLNALRSTTEWTVEPGGQTSRTFLTPSLNLHLNVSDLPQGLRLRTRFRAAHRASSGRSIEPTTTVRAYEVVLERAFPGVTVQAGRFSNPYASYDGYWDGVLVHVGGTRAGFGTAAGFMPDRSNEGFSSEMPRYGGFAHVEVGEGEGPHYRAEVAYNEIRPTSDLFPHRFVGWSHRLRWGGVYLRNDLQVDRDPETGHWVASRVQLRAAVVPSRSVRLHARFRLRQPYSIYRLQRVISYRRDQASAGASFHLAGVILGADAALNYVDDDVGGRVADGQTVSGYVQVPRTGLFDLGVSANASYWQDDDGSSFYLNTGLMRPFAGVKARVHYQFYRTATFGDPLVTHALLMHTVVPLGRGFFSSSQIRLQQSTNLRSAALYTSLWYTF